MSGPAARSGALLRRLHVACTAAAILALLAACTATDAPASPSADPATSSARDGASSAPGASGAPGAPDASDPAATGGMPAAFAAVGDSITDANSPDLAAGDLGSESWATYVVEAGSEFAGGWAEWGAPTSLMAESVTEVDAEVLVMIAGTNDVAFGIPFAETAEHLDRIVDTVGIDEVVISSIPPIDLNPGGAAEFNDELEAFADDRGWRFVDASAGLRGGDGRFADGMSYDGLHPTERGARVLADAIIDELRAG
ncbi:SGNH/GDSL hydrolase family protein [Agromyces sp. LHK192]|uniref:SGNH/GDSL hydrolase family protein n=1 Tax=Agromyces sp. LHK192 TaxID=2498704 RepID=UPI000FDBFCE5|nr:SGNH/GDSL hydrolase family protein [Agromyces sp. LHK192]